MDLSQRCAHGGGAVHRTVTRGALLAVAALAFGCAHAPGPPGGGSAAIAEASTPRWDFFGRPRGGDPWSRAIGAWRLRQRAAVRAGLVPPFPELPAVSAGPDLRGGAPEGYALAHRYDAFLAERRRALAREVLDWVQDVARERFVEDGPVDHWPTLAEVLRSAGDDCDGLELLAYHALRQLGFPGDRIYRAILRRDATGQHHMVTLWFESPEDPWLLDPTDTLASDLRRLSRVEGWVPLKVFSEDEEFTVRPLTASAARDAGQAPPPWE